jgi:hypothetical protein
MKRLAGNEESSWLNIIENNEEEIINGIKEAYGITIRRSDLKATVSIDDEGNVDVWTQPQGSTSFNNSEDVIDLCSVENVNYEPEISDEELKDDLKNNLSAEDFAEIEEYIKENGGSYISAVECDFDQYIGFLHALEEKEIEWEATEGAEDYARVKYDDIVAEWTD